MFDPLYLSPDAMQLYFSALSTGFASYVMLRMVVLFIGKKW